VEQSTVRARTKHLHPKLLRKFVYLLLKHYVWIFCQKVKNSNSFFWFWKRKFVFPDWNPRYSCPVNSLNLFIFWFWTCSCSFLDSLRKSAWNSYSSRLLLIGFEWCLIICPTFQKLLLLIFTPPFERLRKIIKSILQIWLSAELQKQVPHHLDLGIMMSSRIHISVRN